MDGKSKINYFLMASKYWKIERFAFKVGTLMMVILLLLNNSILETVLTSCVVFGLPVLQWRRKHFQGLAEQNRRKDLLDNSLNTKLIAQRTTGYYDNEEQLAGLYKLLVNLFENSLFSSSISAVMLKKCKVKNGLYILFCIGVVAGGIITKDICCIMLDSDIYNKMNESLTMEWEKMKNEFLITDK